MVFLQSSKVSCWTIPDLVSHISLTKFESTVQRKKIKANTYNCLKGANKPLATTGNILQCMLLTQDNKITFCSLQFIFSAVVFASYHLLCFYTFLDSTEPEDKETRVFS